MAFAYILYLDNSNLGQHLKLLRNVCSGELRSAPHVTIRYPVDKLSGNDLTRYSATKISGLVISGCGFFLRKSADGSIVKIIYLECKSDILETLSYKPDFPDSVFHITIYDGDDKQYADELYSLLNSFSWNLILSLPPKSRIKKIDLDKPKVNRADRREFSQKIARDYLLITGRELPQDAISSREQEYSLSSDLSLEPVVSERQKYSLDIVLDIVVKMHESVQYHQANLFEPESIVVGDWLSRTTFQNSLFDEWEPVTESLFKIQREKKNVNGKRHGGYFLTPPELARDIAKRAVSYLGSSEQIEFGDPAIGTGIFFAAMMNTQIKRKLKSSIGIELDEDRARLTLGRWQSKGLNVIHGDFLALKSLPPRNLILANPPYTRFQDINAEYLKVVQKEISHEESINISGLSSLYVYFLLHSHKWLKEGGIAAWLLPSEFMESNYGRILRTYLTEQVQLLQIHRYSANEPQFEDALVTSAVVIFRKCLPDRKVKILFSEGGTLNKPSVEENVSVDQLVSMHKWSRHWLQKNIVSPGNLKVGDLFIVKRGIATGYNEKFIYEESALVSRCWPREYFRPVLPKARFLKSDIIEATYEGYPLVEPQLWMLDSSVSISEITRQSPEFGNYLSSLYEEVKTSTLVSKRKLWYKQESRNPAPFLVTYMAKESNGKLGVRVIWNKSKALATNTYLLVYPRPDLFGDMSGDDPVCKDLFKALSSINLQSFMAEGREYGGGLKKIEPSELLRVELLNVPSSIVDRLAGHKVGD